MKTLLSFLKDITTTKDGESFDVIRVSLIIAGLSLIFLAAWDVIANRTHFNALEFGGGIGTLLGGAGLGIGAKRKDEPDVG